MSKLISSPSAFILSLSFQAFARNFSGRFLVDRRKRLNRPTPYKLSGEAMEFVDGGRAFVEIIFVDEEESEGSLGGGMAGELETEDCSSGLNCSGIMTMAMRRFFARPSGVEFSATG
jgi:hypothetical protein